MEFYLIMCGKYYFESKNMTTSDIVLKNSIIKAATFDDLKKAKEIAKTVGGKVKKLSLTDPE